MTLYMRSLPVLYTFTYIYIYIAQGYSEFFPISPTSEFLRIFIPLQTKRKKNLVNILPTMNGKISQKGMVNIVNIEKHITVHFQFNPFTNILSNVPTETTNGEQTKQSV